MRRAVSSFVPLTEIVSRPPYTAKLQTDGSFSHKYPQISRTAVILTSVNGDKLQLCKTYMNHTSSYESELCSILDGMKFSIKRNQDSIELENDNLGVINSLINCKIPRQPILARYYLDIYKQVRQFEYVGIRWIPRELNKADELFMI